MKTAHLLLATMLLAVSPLATNAPAAPPTDAALAAEVNGVYPQVEALYLDPHQPRRKPC